VFSRRIEGGVLSAVLAAQLVLFLRPLRSGTNYDEGVYLASVDGLRHGETLGSQVFASQFPGFYDLLRGLSYLTGTSVAGLRAGLVVLAVVGTLGAWLVGRHFGGPVGGVLAAALLTIAPPLDLFSFQVIADTPALALMSISLGLGTLTAPLALVGAGAALCAALSVKLTALTIVPALIYLARRRLVPLGLGFAGSTVLFLAAHARALHALWASNVTYHERARDTPAVIPHPRRQILDQIPHETPFFVLAGVAVLIALGALLLRRPVPAWPVWTWTALAVAFLLVHGPLHYNHLVLFPYALAVAAAATLGTVAERLRPGWAAVAGAALVVLIAGGWLQQLHRTDAAKTAEPASNIAAARALARLTPSSARTVDDRPIISFLAHRVAVGSLVDLAALRFKTGSLTDRKVISALGAADAVVVSRVLRDHPRILNVVRRRYRRRFDRGGVQIWIRIRGGQSSSSE
jgi:hypothetical protein